MHLLNLLHSVVSECLTNVWERSHSKGKWVNDVIEWLSLLRIILRRWERVEWAILRRVWIGWVVGQCSLWVYVDIWYFRRGRINRIGCKILSDDLLHGVLKRLYANWFRIMLDVMFNVLFVHVSITFMERRLSITRLGGVVLIVLVVAATTIDTFVLTLTVATVTWVMLGIVITVDSVFLHIPELIAWIWRIWLHQRWRRLRLFILLTAQELLVFNLLDQIRYLLDDRRLGVVLCLLHLL